MEIRRLNADGSGSTTFTFPCNRWLSKSEDDGMIMRELVPAKIVEETVGEKGNIETEEKRVDALTSKLSLILIYYD